MYTTCSQLGGIVDGAKNKMAPFLHSERRRKEDTYTKQKQTTHTHTVVLLWKYREIKCKPSLFIFFQKGGKPVID
jgi:hypothetical protein